MKKIPLDSGFRVAKKQCKNCLFSRDRLVSSTRAHEIIEELVAKQGYFVCHCDRDADEDDPSGGVCCRGFFDSLGHTSQMIRIATRLNIVRFVSLPPLLGVRPYREIHE